MCSTLMTVCYLLQESSLPAPVYNIYGRRLQTCGFFAAEARCQLPGADIQICAVGNTSLHVRGPCDISRAPRDFGYEPRFELQSGIAEWIARNRRFGRQR